MGRPKPKIYMREREKENKEYCVISFLQFASNCNPICLWQGCQTIVNKTELFSPKCGQAAPDKIFQTVYLYSICICLFNFFGCFLLTIVQFADDYIEKLTLNRRKSTYTENALFIRMFSFFFRSVVAVLFFCFSLSFFRHAF